MTQQSRGILCLTETKRAHSLLQKLTVVKCCDIDQRLGGLFFAQLRMIDA